MATRITAKLNHLRITPRKVRAVADAIRGQDVDMAKAQLRYLTRRSASPLEKLLNSAVAGAKYDFGLDESHLYIKEIVVNEGLKLKRYKPKGFGRPMPIQKKTSHIRLVLDELSEEKKKKKDALLAKRPKFEPSFVKASEGKEEKSEEKKSLAATKPRVDKEIAKGSKKGAFGGIKTLGRKLFRRKSI